MKWTFHQTAMQKSAQKASTFYCRRVHGGRRRARAQQQKSVHQIQMIQVDLICRTGKIGTDQCEKRHESVHSTSGSYIMKLSYVEKSMWRWFEMGTGFSLRQVLKPFEWEPARWNMMTLYARQQFENAFITRVSDTSYYRKLSQCAILRCAFLHVHNIFSKHRFICRSNVCVWVQTLF